MANGAYKADSSSDRIKVGEDAPELKGDRPGVVQRHTRPGERAQMQRRDECDDWLGPAGLRLPRTLPCYAVGKDKALQTAVAS